MDLRAPRGLRRAAAVFAALATASCTARPPRSHQQDRPQAPAAIATPAPTTEASPESFRVGTFNAGLAVGVIPYASERAPAVIDALAKAPLDLLCVQEFWLDEHWDQLTRAASHLPHAHRQAPAAPEANRPACTEQELTPLRECASRRCAGLSADQLGACVLAGCATSARKMSLACVNCLVYHPVDTVEAITDRCQLRDPAQRPASAAAGAGTLTGQGVVAYGGSYGTGLLSREPILERDSIAFEATLNPRGALYARLHPEQLGDDLHVFCTHLTPGIEHEQQAQLDRLLDWIEKKTARGGRTLLIGDLNLSPALDNRVNARFPAHYDRVLAAGFRNPYTERAGAQCTFCNSNPLNGGSEARGSLLDHVLVRGHAGAADAELFLQQPITLTSGGHPVRTAYSDHYGLLVNLRRPGGALPAPRLLPVAPAGRCGHLNEPS